MSRRHIVIISKEYPTETNPIYAFVEQLAIGLARQGLRVTVIAPQSVTRTLFGHGARFPRRDMRRVGSGEEILVLRPRHISLSNKKRFGLDLPRWGLASFTRAVRREIKRLDAAPDLLYGHFIFPAGLCVGALAARLHIPGFLGFGESETRRFDAFSDAEIARSLAGLAGVVAVSQANKDVLLARKLYPYPEKIGVFENAADETLFYPRDRAQARKRLGFSEDAFIVAFVGRFDERKGVGRLSRAIAAAGGIASLFIGAGSIAPDCDGILFQGVLPHAQLPEYLAAADAFALPTLNEGCCNAIVEALAMGLPVVSADRAFNDGLLDDTNAIRIDPESVEELTRALMRLRDDPQLRDRLARGARARGATLTRTRRAQDIRAFLDERTICVF